MLPEFFEFHMPTRILYGIGILSHLHEAVSSFGKRRAILITDEILTKIGVVDKVKAGFAGTGIQIVCSFDKIPPNSTIATVEACAKLARQKKCDLIIGLGGGSVMDTAKVVNILTVKGGKVEDHMGAYLLGNDVLLPSILIPTTAGTGSEVSKLAVIADPKNDIKLPFAETQFFPQLAVLDPEITTSMPPGLTAATGMDALTHAIECYVSKDSQPASDALALRAIRMINENLLRACAHPDDLHARGAMLVASCLAGIAFTHAMVGMVHGIAHALGGVYHIPHGLANALVLPEVMEYNLPACPDRYADIAEALGVHFPTPIQSAQSLLHTARANLAVRLLDNTLFIDAWMNRLAARAGIARVRELQRQLGTVAKMPLNLQQAGIQDGMAKLEQVADTAMIDGAMLYNPREPELASVRTILRKIHAQNIKPQPVSAEDVETGSRLQRTQAITHVFDNATMLYKVLGEFYDSLIHDPALGPKLHDSRLIVQFVYEEPSAVITIDASGEQVKMYLGDTYPGKPEVTMSMKADFAHQFWQGKVNIITALTRRQVKSKGNVPKAVKLLPILKPAYELYPRYLQEQGLEQLIA
jgi:alcohol dehydrogenase